MWLGWVVQLGARVWSLSAPHTLRDIPILEPPVTTLDPTEVRGKLEGQVLEGAHGKGWVSRCSPGHGPFGRCLQFLLQSGSEPLLSSWMGYWEGSVWPFHSRQENSSLPSHITNEIWKGRRRERERDRETVLGQSSLNIITNCSEIRQHSLLQQELIGCGSMALRCISPLVNSFKHHICVTCPAG